MLLPCQSALILEEWYQFAHTFQAACAIKEGGMWSWDQNVGLSWHKSATTDVMFASEASKSATETSAD